MQVRALLYTLAAVAVDVANLEAMVDEAAVLEDVQMGPGMEDDTSCTHQDAPITIWTHTAEECGKAPKSTGNSTGTNKSCYYRRGGGHFCPNCPIKSRTKKA